MFYLVANLQVFVYTLTWSELVEDRYNRLVNRTYIRTAKFKPVMVCVIMCCLMMIISIYNKEER